MKSKRTTDAAFYGRRASKLVAVEALALRVMADRIEHGEAVPGEMTVSFAA